MLEGFKNFPEPTSVVLRVLELQGVREHPRTWAFLLLTRTCLLNLVANGTHDPLRGRRQAATISGHVGVTEDNEVS